MSAFSEDNVAWGHGKATEQSESLSDGGVGIPVGRNVLRARVGSGAEPR